MNCPACGTENREGARYCRRCGATLAGATVPEVTPASLPLAVQGNAQPAAAQMPAAGGDAAAPAEPPAEPQELPAEASPAAPAEPPPPAAAEAWAQAAEGELALQPGLEAGEPGVEQPGEEAVPAPADEDEEPALEEPAAATFWREEAPALEPVPPGSVVDGRYAIIEPLDVQEQQILYQAQDLQRCWQCGFDGNSASEAFCARCGAALDRKPKVRLLQVASAEASPVGGESVAGRLEFEGRHFVVLAEPQPAVQPAVAPQGPAVRLVAGQRSVPGQVRDLNEDSVLVLTLTPIFQSQTRPVLGLFAVADGMGGHEGGEIASKLALQVLTGELLPGLILPALRPDGPQGMHDEAILELLRRAVSAANDAVYLARNKRGSDMGTTLTLLLVWDGRLFLAHVGDCRALRWNASGLQQLTTDHSVVATMVASGQIAPDEIYTHPHRSVIYRSIGDKPAVDVDTGTWPVAAGDRLIVCSDGLWEMIRNEGIADALLAEADPQAACNLLAGRANAAGGEDNISVVVVHAEADTSLAP